MHLHRDGGGSGGGSSDDDNNIAKSCKSCSDCGSWVWLYLLWAHIGSARMIALHCIRICISPPFTSTFGFVGILTCTRACEFEFKNNVSIIFICTKKGNLIYLILKSKPKLFLFLFAHSFVILLQQFFKMYKR